MTEVAQATRQINLKDAISEAIDEEMGRDDRVFLLGEDIQDPFGGAFQITIGLSTKYGHQRVVETPIAEAAIVGTAVGAALAGLRPIAEIMIIDFLGVCMDQLYNQAAKARYMSGGQASCPLVIRTESGAGGGFGAQHSQSLEAWLCHVPGLKVVMPSTAADEDPVVYIENLHLYWTRGECPEGDYTVPLGEAAIRRDGSDATVLAWGRMQLETLAAAEELAADGIDVEVIDPRSLVPFDYETLLASVRKTGRLVVAHEAVERGGYGGEIAARVSELAWDSLKGPVRRVAAMNTPIPYARPLETEMLPQRKDVVAAVRAAVGK
jgi:pyruvate/2-oxoglutarate/acetoin dehydrogenase E1 component